MIKKAIFVKKLGMSQIISESGDVEAVTVLKLVESELMYKISSEKSNINRLVVGYDLTTKKKLNKPKLNFLKKYTDNSYKYIKELSVYDEYVPEVMYDCSSFEVNEKISISGKTTGKGFQGTVVAHGFSRGLMSHGSKNHRLPGSIGAGTDPARVLKGTKMAKKLGFKKRTIRNLTIKKIDTESNTIYIKGSVPGKKNNILLIYK